MKTRHAMSRSSYLFGICLCLLLCLLTSNSFAHAACKDSNRSSQPGVGFSLSLDYGKSTSALYFPNGTTVAIAKVEGSPDYKGFMRLAEGEAGSAQPTLNLNHAVDPAWDGWLAGATRAISRLLQNSMRWSSGKSPDAAAIEAMVLALKVSTQAYLSTGVCFSDTAVPYLLSDHQRGLIDAAFSAAGLRRALPTQVLAGHVASRANGIGECLLGEGSCDFDGMDPQLVLTVDYSRAALTMILYVEDRGVFEWRRIQHNVDLGSHVLTRDLDASKEYWERVRKAIEDIVKRPLPEVDSDILDTIGQLVLLGDRVTDPRLLKVLQDVLGAQAFSEARVRSAENKGGIVDPIFAAAIGVAAASYRA